MSGNAGSKTPIGIFRAAPGDNGREPDSCVATAPNADVFPAAAAAISPPEAARKFLRLREQIVELRPMYSLRPALMLVAGLSAALNEAALYALCGGCSSVRIVNFSTICMNSLSRTRPHWTQCKREAPANIPSRRRREHLSTKMLRILTC